MGTAVGSHRFPARYREYSRGHAPLEMEPLVTLIATVCWACIVGLHEECMDPQMRQPEELEIALSNDDAWVVCCCSLSSVVDAREYASGPGRPMLNPEDVTDPKSTGRKRAKMMYPIFPGMTCEWAGLAAAGGGIHPIVGCRGNTIEETKKGPTAGHRHHGPNKNTLDNAASNVHRICTTCHNRWHALNNDTYKGERPTADQPWYPEGDWMPHNTTLLAGEEDFEAAEQFWAGRKLGKVDTED